MSELIDRSEKSATLLKNKGRKATTPKERDVVDSENIISLSEWAPYRGPEFYRTLLVGLSVDCPMGKNPDNCLLRNQRSLSFNEKVTWAQSLSDNKIMDLYLLHHQCFQTMEGLKGS